MGSVTGILQRAQDSAQSRVSERRSDSREENLTDAEDHADPLSAARGMVIGVGIGSVIWATALWVGSERRPGRLRRTNPSPSAKNHFPRMPLHSYLVIDGKGESVMLEALKKFIGMDKNSVEARKKAAEEERREREMRIAEQKEALKEIVEADKHDR